MALSKIQSESMNLTDDYAFTGTVTFIYADEVKLLDLLPDASPKAICVESLNNAVALLSLAPILRFKVTKILLLVALGVMDAVNPVTSTKEEEVVENTSVLTVWITWPTLPPPAPVIVPVKA